ncbi:integrase [Oculatella sp. LEGE 06141]|uniref:integrase n=1 Tax=Oculatella sp. LEGE 06141 TaxID=1828648 RepID=UPI00187DF10C|nr:integrase [Oculatella sp. LEGE 06141]MBE9178654.1 integrase [Oculatella sp. LEGE 06141]
MGTGFDERLAETNQLLSLVSIRIRGKRLSIRGTFPPKPGDGSHAKSYEISAGKPATFAGLRMAFAIAQEMESQLIKEKFDWTPYLKGKQKPSETVGEWVEKFTDHHWNNTKQTPSTLNSWHKDYELKFRHLPLDEPLSLELLKRIILERSDPGTRSRQGYAMAFRLLAEFAELVGADDLKEMGKGYSASRSVNPRDLPSDRLIAAARKKFQSYGWVWLYDALCVYGLRPHEAFVVHTDRLGQEPAVLEVPEETKTGQHTAFPIPADFWEFDVQNYQIPSIKIEGRNNNQLGMSLSQRFRQLEVGFTPYDLRHCYARRGFEFGFPPDFLAKSMGHSLDTHLTKYRAWWGEQPYLKVYQEVMRRRS